MSDERQSVVNRSASVVRRIRSLLSAPELLNKVELQILDISQRLDALSASIEEIYDQFSAATARSDLIIHKLDVSRGEIRDELSSQLAFSFYGQAERISQVQSAVAASLEELRGAQSSAHLGSLDAFQSEVRQSIADLKAHFGTAVDGLAKINPDLQNRAVELSSGLMSRISAIETFQSESRNISTELNTSLNSRMNSLETFQSEMKNALGELNTSLNSRINSLVGLQAELGNVIQHMNTSTASRFNEINNQQFELKNQLTHANTGIETRLDLFENNKLPAIADQIHEMIAVQFELFGNVEKRKADRKADPRERYKPAKSDQWDSSLERAKRQFPVAYPHWKQRLDVMLAAFHELKVGNAAWDGDVYSRIFRNFVERYARGRVLDVGCGIFGRPYYLSDYAPDLVSGLDPLKPEEAPDFEFVRGISEYLPWPDNAFSTVISATSLDHCLSLDQSLAEVDRVLRPNGYFLLWIGSIPGAPKYEPDDPKVPSADKFHLFHFDAAWIEPMLSKMFRVIDRIEFKKVGYNHVMYCFERITN